MKAKTDGGDMMPWPGFSWLTEDRPRFPSLFADFFPWFGTPTYCPTIDVYQDANNWCVKAEVPGLGKDDIKIDVEGRMLTLHGEKKAEEESKEKDYHRLERRWGKFVRRIEIPEEVEPGKASATFKEGILTVTMPIKEGAKKKAVSIQVK